MIQTELKFKVNGKKRHWIFNHNLDEFGMKIEDAFVTWSSRTWEFNARWFRDYVLSKDPDNFKCEIVKIKKP